MTPELAREGLGRDVVRLVQQARRDAGLEVSDRITLTLDAPEPVVDAVTRARDVRGGRGAGDVGGLRAGAGADPVGTVSDGHEVRVLVTPPALTAGLRSRRELSVPVRRVARPGTA